MIEFVLNIYDAFKKTGNGLSLKRLGQRSYSRCFPKCITYISQVYSPSVHVRNISIVLQKCTRFSAKLHRLRAPNRRIIKYTC